MNCIKFRAMKKIKRGFKNELKIVRIKGKLYVVKI